MKKTLLAFVLSASGLLASTDVFDFGRADLTTSDVINRSTTTSEAENLTNLQGSYTFSNTGSFGNTLAGLEAGAYWKADFAGTLPDHVEATMRDALLATGSTASFTLTFTGLEAGTYNLSAFGGFLGSAHSGSFGDNNDEIFGTITLAVSGANTDAAQWSGNVYGTSGWTEGGTAAGASSLALTVPNNSNKGYNATVSGIVVGESGTLTFTITGSDSDASSYAKLPLNSFSLTLVPEPTTAMLSLLALAGLVARRRRK